MSDTSSDIIVQNVSIELSGVRQRLTDRLAVAHNRVARLQTDIEAERYSDAAKTARDVSDLLAMCHHLSEQLKTILG